MLRRCQSCVGLGQRVTESKMEHGSFKPLPPSTKPLVNAVFARSRKITMMASNKNLLSGNKSGVDSPQANSQSVVKNVSIGIHRWKAVAEKRINFVTALKKPQNERTDPDLEAIFIGCQKLAFFQQFPSAFLKKLCFTLRVFVVVSDDERICESLCAFPYHTH